jgi:hypothetical protein
MDDHIEIYKPCEYQYFHEQENRQLIESMIMEFELVFERER